jgi:branched-subunit amino acid transport protein AzlD
MKIDTLTAILIIAVVAAVTFITRVLPFLFFRNRETPKIIVYLGNVLPPAIMGLLIVYCLKGVSFAAYPYGLPELIAIAVVAALQTWKKNILLSIFSGTALYMVLVQLVFV